VRRLSTSSLALDVRIPGSDNLGKELGRPLRLGTVSALDESPHLLIGYFAFARKGVDQIYHDHAKSDELAKQSLGATKAL
jgi:hypothetical protein